MRTAHFSSLQSVFIPSFKSLLWFVMVLCPRNINREAITQKVEKLWLWVLYTALFLIEISLPTKFHFTTFLQNRAMLRGKVYLKILNNQRKKTHIVEKPELWVLFTVLLLITIYLPNKTQVTTLIHNRVMFWTKVTFKY